ncbi:MAG TPA: hypothetical protein VN946_16945 [Terriglobales bacterium]|jgi:hypothetical protein|nr:hypothetical protein [Terriglobales bacterium]
MRYVFGVLTFVAFFFVLVGIGYMLRYRDPVWVGAVPAALGLTFLWLGRR